MLEIRQATVEDTAVIVGHRRSMFEDMGTGSPAALDAMDAGFEPWLRERLASGGYLGWLAVDPQGGVAAGAGLWLMDWLPGPSDASSRRGNIVNVYTRPDYRRQGLARRLVQAILDWCRANGIRTVILHASDFGRPLYESLGFEATNEMRTLLD